MVMKGFCLGGGFSLFFLFFFLRVSARYAASNSREAATAQKEPSRGNPSKAAGDIIIARRWHGSSSWVRGETEMKKNPALGRKAQSGLRKRAGARARMAKKGSRRGSDKPAIGKPLRERVVLRTAWHWLLSPNGHSYDMSDVGQPRLFSPLWRRHTEQRDNEVQSGGGKEGQL